MAELATQTGVMIDAGELLNAIKIAQGVHNTAGTLLRVAAADGAATMDCTHDGVGARIHLAADVDADLEAVVKMRDLTKAAKHNGAGDVLLTQHGDGLRVGEIQVAAQTGFTPMPFDDEGDVVVWAGIDLAGEIERAAQFVSDDPHRPSLGTIHIDHTAAGQQVLVATDSYHMLIAPAPGQVTEGTDLLVHAVMLDQATLGLDEEAGFQVQLTETHVRVVIEGEVWIAARAKGVPVNWRGVLTDPSYATGPFDLDCLLGRDSLLAALDNTLSGCTPQAKMSMVVAGMSLQTSARAKTGEQIIDTIELVPIEGDADGLADGYEVILDPKLLRHVADALDAGETIRMRQAAPLKMVFFDDGVRVGMQMPCERQPGETRD